VIDLPSQVPVVAVSVAPTTATPLIEGGATLEGACRLTAVFCVVELVLVAVTSAPDWACCPDGVFSVVEVPLVVVATASDLDCCPGGVF
jgi:hypothetical protein